MHDRLDEVLPLVTKPIRYTGGEYNALLTDPDSSRVSWVLSMPEVYELGMSNYGLVVKYDGEEWTTYTAGGGGYSPEVQAIYQRIRPQVLGPVTSR